MGRPELEYEISHGYHTFNGPPEKGKMKPTKVYTGISISLRSLIGFISSEYTVSEAVEHIGFGWFQILIGCASGFAWIADGMEIMVISILGPTLLCEWGISTMQEALLTTVVFAGFFFGSPVFGYIADRFGRRKSLLLSSMWVSFYGVLSAISPTLGWLYFLRAMVGFGVGGASQACTYFAEFLPIKTRGSGLMCVEVFFALGGALEVVLGIVVLTPYGWNWWLIASAVPSMIYVITCYWLPNTPRYCMATGDIDGAMETLKMAARLNRKQLPEGKLVREPLAPRGRPQDLVSPRFRTTSILLLLQWLFGAFSYFGVVLFSTELIRVGDTCNPEDFADDDTGCEELTLGDYESLLWTSFAELPGLFIGAILIEIIGRRMGLAVLYIVYSVTCFLLFICMQTVPMVFLLFVCRAFVAAAYQVLFVYTPEVYPTEIRALALGCASSFGRIGAICTPYVAEVLLDLSLWYGLSVYGSIGIISAVLAVCLPIETKGRMLKEAATDAKQKYDGHQPILSESSR